MVKLKLIKTNGEKVKSPKLIIGIGAFKHKDTDVQYIGSAFSFQNNGASIISIVSENIRQQNWQVKDIKVVRELLDQVYQFSRIYWKSTRQQNLPVTIKYPEIVAEMFPHFEGNEIPPYGRDKLWFL